MKYFVVADVHGFFNEMITALEEQGWEYDNPEHIFVSLGDLLDRGRQPEECLHFVNDLPKERKILIRGNHESLMEAMIKRGIPTMGDLRNGTAQTIADYYKDEIRWYDDYERAVRSFGKSKDWKDYIDSCINYYELESNVFVHGWIPDIEDWRIAHYSDWYDASWHNGMNDWNNGIRESGSTIWCGHWHTSWGHCHIHHDCETEFGEDAIFTPFKDEGICAMDACTAYSGSVNCEVIEI